MTTVQKTIYFDAELEQRINIICERERRSFNQQVLKLVESGLDEAEASGSLSQQIRSISVSGDETRDMATGERVDPVTLEPAKPTRKPRTTACEHGFTPDQHCKRCDP